MRRWCAYVALLLVSTGCEGRLSALHGPPPGRIAELDETLNQIHLSRGVALAVECYDSGPCNNTSMTFDDPSIAEAREVFFDELVHDPDAQGPTPKAVFVVVAKQAGTTTLRVRGDLDTDYELTVFE